MTNPRIRAFFDEPTNTVSYLVWDPDTAKGAVIDPVLDFDLASGEADVRSAEAILSAAEEEGVTIERVLETHAHADHLSAAPFIKAKTGATIGGVAGLLLGSTVGAAGGVVAATERTKWR